MAERVTNRLAEIGGPGGFATLDVTFDFDPDSLTEGAVVTAVGYAWANASTRPVTVTVHFSSGQSRTVTLAAQSSGSGNFPGNAANRRSPYVVLSWAV